MKQDITPIKNQQRGSLRPPARPDVINERPVTARPPFRRNLSIDGVVGGKPGLKAPGGVVGAIGAMPRAVIEPVVAPTAGPVIDSIVEPKKEPLITDIYTVENTVVGDNYDHDLPAQPFTEAPVAGAKQVAGPDVKPGDGGDDSGVSDNSSDKPSRKKFDFRKTALIGLAVVLVLVTSYVAYDTWVTNNKAQAILSEQSSGDAVVVDEEKDQEGRDESVLTPNILSNYKVAPDMPRALYIDKLDIEARTLPMGLNKDNSIQAPKNIFDTGWYEGSVKPGETGAVFVDGHASGPTRQGIFAYIDTLVKGDTLQLEKGDGTRLTYRVVHVETVPLDGIDMKKALLPYGNATKGLNLMTCTGTWMAGDATYDHRAVVYTEQI